MKKTFISLVTLLSFINIAYANDNELLKKSKSASKSLLGTLKTQLTQAMKKGDTKKAVVVCSSIAQNIAKDVSKKNNLSIKRVSLKNRNINGKPDAYEEKNLKIFNELNKNGKITPTYEVFETVVEKDKKSFRYMKPIITGKTCLQCHGNPEQIKPEVKKILKEKYPHDTALGYKEGDIRGAVSVKVEIF